MYIAAVFFAVHGSWDRFFLPLWILGGALLRDREDSSWPPMSRNLLRYMLQHRIFCRSCFVQARDRQGVGSSFDKVGIVVDLFNNCF